MKKFTIILLLLLISSIVNATVIKDIVIEGNERVSSETILMFSNININDNIDEKKINKILIDLYETNFFDNIKIDLNNSELKIIVKELPIIESINFTGLKAKKHKEAVKKNLNLRSRSSYNKFLLSEDKKEISNTLRGLGYYFSNVDVFIEDLSDNKVNVNYIIDLGNKSKIKKISFIVNKIFKEGKLKSLIISEEYKFWKFISGKKFLNENLIKTDERLLKNFYLNKGYYNVTINTSFAKVVNDDQFELIYNIDPGRKIYFNDLSILYPSDFRNENFDELSEFLVKLKGEPYSISTINQILDRIDNISINEEFQSVKSEAQENFNLDKIDITFRIEESEKFIVDRINIYGNNITRESVIRNQLEIDEGDLYNEILTKKSENNLKSLNFFSKVKTSVVDGEKEGSKIINIDVREKPTGEISAGAGFGTQGGTISFGIRENNYMGKGLSLDTRATLTEETFKGKFSITNPNFKNSDKSVFLSLEAQENDQLKDFGYKTNKTGFEIGTNFEYLDDFNLGLSTRSFYEVIDTDSTASVRQKKQKGNYWDSFVKLNFDYDKRNQIYKTSDGFRSNYSIDIPIISDTNTLTNTYAYRHYSELFENNISSFSLYLRAANSLTGDNVKLSERLFIPSSRLRGFENGKVGPKDGDDFIGGNYVSAMNISSTVPQFLSNLENLDVLVFFDAANIWGVDYDSSLNGSGKIRSSVGIGIDWYTIVGPINFSLTETISKDSSDITESFRFNIGTTF